ncbi:MAG: hypothetical protein QM741_12500 [Rudaea sp.]|uniref:DUF1302 family protein n=1 Tax=Rudaea sp. TaxID=2136325 RepID=UPI0039E3126E
MKSQNKIAVGLGALSLAIAQSLAAAPASDSSADPATTSDALSDSGSGSGGGGSSGGSGVQFGGFIRSETAINTKESNPYNQLGMRQNGVPIERVSPIATDTVTRNGGSDDARLNLQAFRAQLDATMHFNDALTGVIKLRALYDPDWYDNFDPGAVNSHSIGYVYGEPNLYKYHTAGNARPNPLEWSGSSYMIDLPAFFLEYNQGPLDVRVGNQQIAWGQSLFFRVLDVPNGLDLRRHSIIDYAPEEYSDKRVPSLAVRASLQFDNGWLIDGFVEKFQPSILGNPNTPYNVIPSQFTIHDLYAQYDDKFNEGIRAKGTVGDLGLQFMYAHRYNPDGVYRWTQSGVNRDIPGLPGSGALMACSPFEVDPSGVWTSNEWFYSAASARLNGVQGLNAAINDFACSQKLGAVPVPNYQYASAELNQFFQLAGGLLSGQSAGGMRGHLARDYKQEDNIGAGLTYTFSGAPGSLTDQLILNWEVMYTPNRTFTAPDINVNFLRTNEWVSNISLEKYQRFSENLPATYLVAEFMYKSKSDLFGRYIGSRDGGGYSGTEFANATGYSGGFKALVLAAQQPFPNLVWRFDFAVLYDLQGGVLIQPAVRWKPSGNWSAEFFYNYINARLGGNQNKNMFGSLEFGNEVSARVTYQF